MRPCSGSGSASGSGDDPFLSAGIYTKFLLSSLYEVGVLNINFGLVWGCSAHSVLLPFFSRNMSRRRHLDCGVGTGFFLTHTLEALGADDDRDRDRDWEGDDDAPPISITLLDLNPNCLDTAAKSIQAAAAAAARKTRIECVVADIRSPIPPALLSPPGAGGKRFDSISMFNLFHCVPGGRAKFDAIRIYKALLADDGVLTGSTILGRRHATGWFAPAYLTLYNWLGIFSNLDDTQADVAAVLEEEFTDAKTWTQGMVLMFRGKGPRR
ncbi:methyltransferase domain-containing protein [Xylariaceae sp. FL0594]|nr:methyltransferase domain-containing protein [Xylariaceae sp. FL0594]